MLKNLRILLLALVVASGAACRAYAAVPADVQFDEAYQELLRADEARDKGDNTLAVELYRSSLNHYTLLSERYPDWQPGIVRFRIAYCDNQLETILKPLDDESAQQAGVPRPPAPPVPPNGTAGELAEVRSQALELLSQGEGGKAREVLLEGLRLAPDDPKLRLLTGLAQCETGQYDDAVLVLEQLLEDAPDEPRVRLALAAAYFGAGEPARAVEQLNAALARGASQAEVHYNLAQVLLAMTPDDLEDARKHYREALRLGGPPDADLARRLGMP